MSSSGARCRRDCPLADAASSTELRIVSPGVTCTSAQKQNSRWPLNHKMKGRGCVAALDLSQEGYRLPVQRWQVPGKRNAIALMRHAIKHDRCGLKTHDKWVALEEAAFQDAVEAVTSAGDGHLLGRCRLACGNGKFCNLAVRVLRDAGTDEPYPKGNVVDKVSVWSTS